MRYWVCFTVVLASAFGAAVFAGAAVLDLTTPGNYGTINGAAYYQSDPRSTGTGVIDSFLRIQRNVTEQGYNTDYCRFEFDEKAGAFTHSLAKTTVPLVNIDGVTYREFLLDINEPSKTPDNLLSLDKLQIFLGSAGNLHDYPAGLGRLIYDLDAGCDNWIKLDYNLATGSGSGDMFAYIPDSLFAGPEQYVYLYSYFGAQGCKNNGLDSADGFEEWAVRENASVAVPEPGSIAMALLGLASVVAFRLKRHR